MVLRVLCMGVFVQDGIFCLTCHAAFLPLTCCIYVMSGLDGSQDAYHVVKLGTYSRECFFSMRNDILLGTFKQSSVNYTKTYAPGLRRKHLKTCFGFVSYVPRKGVGQRTNALGGQPGFWQH
eukprot:6491584-Amphidinium_carterae.2